MNTPEAEWEREVYNWRKWALKTIGVTIKDYQQASDLDLRKQLSEYIGNLNERIENLYRSLPDDD